MVRPRFTKLPLKQQQFILQAALDEFAAYGFHDASLNRMIEAAGFKGLREGDAGISNRHALVLVNHGAATGPQLWALAQKVMLGVREKFGVQLEPEPVVIGAG